MRRAAVLLMVTMVTLTGGCAGVGALGGGSGTTIRVAVVANPQMADVETLTPEFEKQHPGMHVKYVTLPENEARDKITQSVATGSGEFDVVMISNYETPIWARNGWLTNLQPSVDSTPGYDPGDFLPTVRTSLSYHGDMYSAPFYGEGSFLMYRKDLFAKHHLTMPAHPTWPQVAALAKKLNDPAHNMTGICLRGRPGWGEVMAPLNTVINSFGGRWFDPRWQPQLTSPQTRRAVQFYVDLVRNQGEPGAATSGFTECLNTYAQGNAAMWYDATSAAGSLEDKATSTVVGRTGYVPAPREQSAKQTWLYSWSLAIPKTTQDKKAAWSYLSWATSKQYIKLVGQQLGWTRLPPGSRTSTYRIPQYHQAARAFAAPTLNAIGQADTVHPTVQPVPYTGGQFVDIPEFVDLGTRVSQQVTAAIAGSVSVNDALDQSRDYADTVGETYRR